MLKNHILYPTEILYNATFERFSVRYTFSIMFVNQIFQIRYFDFEIYYFVFDDVIIFVYFWYFVSIIPAIYELSKPTVCVITFDLDMSQTKLKRQLVDYSPDFHNIILPKQIARRADVSCEIYLSTM